MYVLLHKSSYRVSQTIEILRKLKDERETFSVSYFWKISASSWNLWKTSSRQK